MNDMLDRLSRENIFLEVVIIKPALMKAESPSVVSNSLQPHGLCGPWNSPGQNTSVVSFFLLQIFPTQGSNPGLLHCRQIFLPAEPQEKPKNTGVGNLSILQGIFLTQELDQGLLHCRQILYELSYLSTFIFLCSKLKILWVYLNLLRKLAPRS